ncbi:MAG: nitrogen fixation protein NifU [Halothiobacillaceae bacterium]|nr:MAG: nitrogen fixation protein NifU [Halothiobacillaceae bacterium]
MAYSEKVLDHYENPRNVGTFNKDDPNVGTGMVGAPACGDDLRLRFGYRVQLTPHRVGKR